MLTPEQQRWVDHLSDTDTIKIIPFDPTAEEKFLEVKKRIQLVLGEEQTVQHRGATSLGISGQDEIDVYIPVHPHEFDSQIQPLTKLFGNPGSLYPLERARFETEIRGKHITVFLINQKSKALINGITFEAYLRSNPQALEEYRQLKELGAGLSIREYYRRKIEFINEILGLVGK